MMMYWKPDKTNTLLFSMLGRFSDPVRVELSGIYLEWKQNPGIINRLNPVMCVCWKSRAPRTIPATWWWRGQPADPGGSCRCEERCFPARAEPAGWPGVCRSAAPGWGLLSPSPRPETSSGKCPRTGTAGHLNLSSTTHTQTHARTHRKWGVNYLCSCYL